ncbi:hypothetical protein [Halomontanus rarus]|uniref:hypothetical protein n=1 Tax=Halomontanus rarus TaxID=3034020 RepID=UPI0023E8E335|nr:hypothetical protein [Halovivax sp. TS33]
MDIQEHHQTFLSIEEDLDLFGATIDGIRFWERVRYSIYRRTLTKSGIWGKAHSELETSMSHFARRVQFLIGNVFNRNPFLASSHEFLFWGHERRKREEDGMWWDIYCDPIHEELGLDYLHMERPHLDRHLQPAQTKNLRYFDLLDAIARIQQQFVTVNFTDCEQRFLDRIRRSLKRKFGVDIDITHVVKKLLSFRRCIKPLYERFLKRVNPLIVVLVVSYGGKETFIEVCKTMDIPVIELQHGIINEYASAYSFPGDRSKHTFPDYLFTFGDFWNEGVEFPINDNRIIPVGYPYLEKNASRYANVQERNQILFISQGIIAEPLSKMATQLAERCDINHEIIYKLHPGEYDRWRTEYPWLSKSSVTVVGSNGKSLYRLFAESTAQIGVSSTALFEGLIFDLDTYLVDLPTIEFMRDVVDKGYMTVIETIDELVGHLRSSSDHNPDINLERIFQSNSVENIAQAFNTVRDETDSNR